MSEKVQRSKRTNDIIPIATERRSGPRNKPSNQSGRSRFFSGMGVGFSPDQIEFMKALDKFKRDAGRPFPTCSEVLDVLLALGYRKDEPAKKK